MRTKTRINWDVFTQNSSSKDSVADFARGTSYTKSLEGMWCPDARREFRKLKRLPVGQARKRVARWRNSYFQSWR